MTYPDAAGCCLSLFSTHVYAHTPALLATAPHHRPGIMPTSSPSGRRRALLSSSLPQRHMLASRATHVAHAQGNIAAAAAAARSISPGRKLAGLNGHDRSLLWAPSSPSFKSFYSGVYYVCPVTQGPYSPFVDLDLGNSNYYGQMIVDNWMCDRPPTGMVRGAAADGMPGQQQQGSRWVDHHVWSCQ